MDGSLLFFLFFTGIVGMNTSMLLVPRTDKGLHKEAAEEGTRAMEEEHAQETHHTAAQGRSLRRAHGTEATGARPVQGRERLDGRRLRRTTGLSSLRKK